MLTVYHRALRPATPPFSFNDTATTEIYTLSLHDALPILLRSRSNSRLPRKRSFRSRRRPRNFRLDTDRKSTRLNSSHPSISYAVFCLKKKTALRFSTLHSHFSHSQRTFCPIPRYYLASGP